jgi:hypothetical protein
MVEQAPNTKIARQIETSADYYPPATYSGSVASYYLTYFNEVTLNTDSLGEQYIPISTVPQNSKNPKLFAIGVIPPSANITGRILDRSASATNLVVDDTIALEAMASDNSAGLAGTELPQEFWVDYVNMCDRLGVDAKEMAAVLYAESGFDPAAVNYQNGRPVAKGLNQIIKKNEAVVGLAPGEWDSYETWSAREQLPIVENYFSKCGVRGKDRTGIYASNFGGFSNPNGSRYASLAFINSYQPEADRAKFKNPTTQESCYRQNIGLDKEGKGYITTADLGRNAGKGAPLRITRQIDDAEAFVASGQTLSDPVQADANAANLPPGSVSDAREIQDKTANTPLIAEDLAQRFTAAQRAQITAVQKALEAMQNVPPLRMLVNPQSFSVKGEKIVSDGGWSRNGNTIVEHWGNNQEKISASGKVAGFYAIDALNAVAPGLTRMARNYSQAWQNFQSLCLFYNNNGGLHTRDMTTATEERNLAMLGSVYLFYDDILYIGSFDSLSVNENDTAPHTVDYSFEFTVRAAFVLDNPNQNDKGNYGSTSSTGALTTSAFFNR